jgi:F-type H+-transporting ATPase subunit delta
MNAGAISTRYAKAIFQYALERGEEESLHAEMKTLARQFTALPLLKKVLEDPSVSTARKIEVLHTAAGKTPGNAYRQAVRLVIRNGREHYMQHIALVYDKLCRKEKNKTLVKLTTTEPTGVELQKTLINLIAGGKDLQVDFETITDQNIIGGFILEVDDARLDASVKNQLNRLRMELINKGI